MQKKVADKDKNGEIAPKLESVEVVLVHCNLVKNDSQHTSKILFSFVPNKQFGKLINISPHSLTMINTINTEFSHPAKRRRDDVMVSVRPSDVSSASQRKHPTTSL